MNESAEQSFSAWWFGPGAFLRSQAGLCSPARATVQERWHRWARPASRGAVNCHWFSQANSDSGHRGVYW